MAAQASTAAQMSAQANLNSATAAISAQQQFIVNSFRGQILISNQLDVQDTPLYDTITYTAGATITTANSTFFQNVEANSGKTPTQTNMDTNGRLDAPEAFSVFGIRLGWSEDILRADLQTLLNTWAFQFQMLKKYYSQANIRHYSAGWGITGYTTRTAESFYTNGMPGRGSMNLLSVKLVIANQQTFQAQLIGAANQVLSVSGNGLILICELVGLYARGVQ
jgi:hypothetical protein